MTEPLQRLLAKKSPLILGGAMGTELERRGVDIGIPLWSANALVGSPGVVLQIHKDYIEAGSDIIVTNTFRTNRRVFKNANLADRSLELTTKAVALAHRARECSPDRELLIAGCVAPVEDCYRPDLVPTDKELLEEHTELVHRLAELGVDFLLIETMTTIREAYAAASAAKSTGMEFVVSFTCKPDAILYGGENLTDAVQSLSELEPTMLSLNCVSPRYLGSLMTTLKGSTTLPLAVYGNIGKPDVREGNIVRDVDEIEYTRFALEWKELGASLIGGCCGTTPEYIRSIAKSL